ncbi:unnamed protein product, partial [Closterium sp. NIES-54]
VTFTFSSLLLSVPLPFHLPSSPLLPTLSGLHVLTSFPSLPSFSPLLPSQLCTESYRLTWKGRVVGGGGGRERGREGGGGSGGGGMQMNARRVVGMGISVNVSTPPMHSPHLSATAPLTHPPHIAAATPGGVTAVAGGDFCPDAADAESDAFPVHGEGPFRLERRKRRAVGNRTHRERRRTSSCLAEHIAPVRRDPQRMLRDGRRPRGNSRRCRRPATTRRRVVFRANGDDRRLPRRQHEPRLKGHLRRGRCAERRAARRHDPRMTRAPAVHSPAPFTPHSVHSLSPPVVSPPTVLVFPPFLFFPASPCLSIWFLPQTLPLHLQRVCVASRSEAGCHAALQLLALPALTRCPTVTRAPAAREQPLPRAPLLSACSPCPA